MLKGLADFTLRVCAHTASEIHTSFRMSWGVKANSPLQVSNRKVYSLNGTGPCPMQPVLNEEFCCEP